MTLELAAVTWVCPYGAVLLCACRYLSSLTKRPVEIAGPSPEVQAYLRRIDFFNQASGTAYTATPFDGSQELARSLHSSNVLELVTVERSQDVYVVSKRAR